MKFEVCTGVYGAITASYDSVRPYVPADFYIRGQAPDLADLGFVATTCARVVNQTRIAENVSYLTTFAWVIPKNESWAPDFNSRYVFDFYFSDPLWAADFKAWGAESSKAEFSIAETIEDAISGWTVTNGSENYEFMFHTIREPQDKTPGGVYHWFGTGPFLRVDEALASRSSEDVQAGVLNMGGESTLSKASGGMRAEWVGGPHFDKDASFVLVNQSFVGGK
jgi:hypothetical protein